MIGMDVESRKKSRGLTWWEVLLMPTGRDVIKKQVTEEACFLSLEIKEELEVGKQSQKRVFISRWQTWVIMCWWEWCSRKEHTGCRRDLNTEGGGIKKKSTANWNRGPVSYRHHKMDEDVNCLLTPGILFWRNSQKEQCRCVPSLRALKWHREGVCAKVTGWMKSCRKVLRGRQVNSYLV